MTRSRDVADTQDNIGGAVAPFVGAKNKIINGDFSQWQRGTSFTASGAYTADRWVPQWNGSPTLSISRQTFTPGAAPVAGYEGQYFLKLNVTSAGSGASFLLFAQQRIEDVRTFAGQTATLSLWARSTTSVNVGLGVRQNFGSGGSAEQYPSVIDITGPQTTAEWKRLVYNITFPSIAGRTIGSNSYIAIDIYSNGINTVHQVDIWGVQLESGSVATPFTPAGGGFPGAELALCQRYYQRWAISSFTKIGTGVTYDSSNIFACVVPIKTTMRATPTLAAAGLAAFDGSGTYTATLGTNLSTTNNIAFDLTVSGAVALRVQQIGGNNTANAYFEASAEL